MRADEKLTDRELDAKLAEALGDRVIDGFDGLPTIARWSADRTCTTTHDIPHYSTDWRDTGALIEAMRERGFLISMHGGGPSGKHAAIFTTSSGEIRTFGRTATTLPRAVAAAALAALTQQEDTTHG